MSARVGLKWSREPLANAGAIASSTGNTRYYLKIGDRPLRTYRSAWEQAPDVGYVRAYYLPRTRRLVNLERLPNPPLPANPDEARDMVGRIARAFVTDDSGARAARSRVQPV